MMEIMHSLKAVSLNIIKHKQISHGVKATHTDIATCDNTQY